MPLPISEDELKASVENNPNLTLQKVSQREDEKDVYITAEIAFKDVEEFTDVESFSAMPMSLEKKDGEYIFRQMISEGSGGGEDEEEPDEQTKAMMASFFEGYELAFTVNAPSSITSHNLGELSGGGKTVSYTLPLLDMDSLKEETVLEVRWRS